MHEYDAATHQWVELSAEKRQQMAAQAHSPISTFADNSADSAAGILDTYVKEGSQQNFSHDERLWISNTNYYGNRLTYLRMPLIIAPKSSTSSPPTRISRKSAIQVHYLHAK